MDFIILQPWFFFSKYLYIFINYCLYWWVFVSVSTRVLSLFEGLDAGIFFLIQIFIISKALNQMLSKKCIRRLISSISIVWH
jgi:hypothetical protein